MNRLNAETYSQLFLSALNGENWQSFVDRYNEKYNYEVVPDFQFAPTSLSYSFQQLTAMAGAKTLPAYVDVDSPGYLAALNDLQGVTGNIPTQKKFYRLDRRIVLEKLQLIERYGLDAMDKGMRDAFLSLLDESTDGLITSFYNALVHQRMQIVSKGKFTIDTTNNPRGLNGITIEFGIPTKNFDTLATTKRWWTDADHTTEGTAADPLGYLRDRVKYIRKDGHYSGVLRMEMSRDLWDDMINHSAVLKAVGLRLYPAAASESIASGLAKNADEDVVKEVIRKIVRVDSIKINDAYAFIDKPTTDTDGAPDLVATRIESFDPKVVAFVPDGELGNIQGVEPITLGYDEDKVAGFEGNRLKLMQYAEPHTHSLYIESEAAQICVPDKPNYMFISTVTA